MKYAAVFLIALPHLPVSGQPPDRKPAIEKVMEKVYSVKEFRRVADSLQMSVDELSGYPVIFPVRKSVISSGFGMRRHPVYKARKLHAGIDFASVKGAPVYAAGSGVVIRKGYDAGYGMFIEIEHAGGFRSFYAHLSRATVSRGDSVRITQQIACVGDTGTTTGSHLHYEVRKGQRILNPAGWCSCLWELLKDEW